MNLDHFLGFQVRDIKAGTMTKANLLEQANTYEWKMRSKRATGDSTWRNYGGRQWHAEATFLTNWTDKSSQGIEYIVPIIIRRIWLKTLIKKSKESSWSWRAETSALKYQLTRNVRVKHSGQKSTFMG